MLVYEKSLEGNMVLNILCHDGNDWRLLVLLVSLREI